MSVLDAPSHSLPSNLSMGFSRTFEAFFPFFATRKLGLGHILPSPKFCPNFAWPKKRKNASSVWKNLRRRLLRRPGYTRTNVYSLAFANSKKLTKTCFPTANLPRSMKLLQFNAQFVGHRFHNLNSIWPSCPYPWCQRLFFFQGCGKREK